MLRHSDHLMPEIYTSTLLETDMGKARISGQCWRQLRIEQSVLVCPCRHSRCSPREPTTWVLVMMIVPSLRLGLPADMWAGWAVLLRPLTPGFSIPSAPNGAVKR